MLEFIGKANLTQNYIREIKENTDRLYKIKNTVQPAFYQKVRMMINMCDLEKAE